MMPILVKSNNVRSGRKAKAHHGWLWAAQESMGQHLFFLAKVLSLALVSEYILVSY